MSRISDAFARGRVLIPFLTCGDPDLETTQAAVRALAQAGAGMIALGIPFSDPTAEGPVVQAANARALAAGTTADKALELVRRLRRDVDIPLAFVTYANVVFSYGTERFLSAAAEAGVDGIILPDVPYEEKEEFEPACRACGLDLISIAASTSEGRTAMIAGEAAGFLYCLPGSEGPGDVARMVRLAGTANPGLPCAAGFEGSDPEQAAALAQAAGGVLASSAFVELTARYGREAVPRIRDCAAALKRALEDRAG